MASGFERWASAIRSRMENDPGRQDLEDHILCNGFLFLQEYLEDILNGTRSDPIIELTKTPGRRKDMSKKDRLESATKSKQFSESPDKENINIFSHKPVLSFQKPQSLRSIADEQDEKAVEILVTPPSTSSKKPDPKISPTASRTVKFFLEPDSVGTNQNNELSMIAEGDEQEAAQALVSPRKGLVIGEREISYQIPKDPDDPDGPMATITVPYSEEDRSFDSDPTSTISSFPIDPYARDYETHELPKVVPVASPPRVEETQPIPMQVQGPNLTRKASVPVFPNLPPPSPMRKSTRESVNITSGIAIKPTGNGTRTSWLQKAKDVTAKHGGVKRRSGEMLEDYTGSTDSLGRLPKVARTEDGNPELSANTAPSKAVIQPFRPIAKPRDPPSQIQYGHLRTTSNEDTDGMMDVLKRTVEGLGVRVGKSLGKSLGGAAATAAAAEAKAAAEARLAQREVKGSDGALGAHESGSAKGHDSRESFSRPAIPVSPIAPRLLLDRASITSTSPDSPPMSQIRVVSQNSIPQFQVQRQPLKDYNSQSQSQGHSQPSTQSTYVSTLFDDNPTWTQSSFATEYTATQTYSQSRSQEDNQMRSEYQNNAVHYQNVQWSQHSEVVDKKLQGNEFVIQDDEYHEALDEEEMVLGRDAIPHVVKAPSKDFDDVQTQDDTSPQSSQEKPQGFVAQASNIISKVMGSATLKRTKPEPVKSIQLAAVAAKKQQEEAEKKAARLKEMEKRRAVIASKKAEQDATDKSKLHKREREDETTKILVKKTDDDTTKKRKVTVEIEKKPISIKKPPSKDKISTTSVNAGVVRTLSKPTLPSQTPLPPPSLVKSTKRIANTQTPGPTPQLNVKSTSSQSQLDPKTAYYEDMRQPSEALYAQMQARVQVQMMTQAKQQELQEPPIPSESIELPDINSEYSNSEDEDRPRTFDPPDWAQSPVLAQALQSQSRLNPDDIFGPVKPLRMEEIFKKNTSRFRARTSSANWAGTDELTKEEESAYAKRMGYVKL